MKLTAAEVRRATLRRQFPTITGRDEPAVLRLFERVGPVQSQTPRSPFLTAASRLPGVAYATVNALFTDHRLRRSTSVRGTVFTTTAQTFGPLAAVADRYLTQRLGALHGLDDAQTAALTAVLDDACRQGWTARADIVATAERWLTERLGAPPAGLRTAVGTSLVWGRPSMLRRPVDGGYERRTDAWHRVASELVDDPPVTADDALPGLCRAHLASFGPATRRDIAWFLGELLTRVDAALAALGDDVVTVARGLTRDPLLDLAEPPTDGDDSPGVRLLPEFDALLLGYTGEHRNRFLDPAHLPLVWRKANGVFSPVVLRDNRIVATWRTTRPQRRTDLEVTMLPGERPLTERLLTPAIEATAGALQLEIGNVRVDGTPR